MDTGGPTSSRKDAASGAWIKAVILAKGQFVFTYKQPGYSSAEFKEQPGAVWPALYSETEIQQ